MGYARRIIQKFLLTQPKLNSYVANEDDLVGHLKIYCEDDEQGNDEIFLKITDNGVEEIQATKNIKHSIQMHVDTFLDILTGSLDFGDAWAKNLITVEGEKKTLHVARWIKWIRKMRNKVQILAK